MTNRSHLFITGNLTADPELSYTASGLAITKFTVAVNPRTKKESTASFFKCTVFGNTAENLNKYKSKGDVLEVEGTFEITDWVDKDGNKHRSHQMSRDIRIDYNTSPGINHARFKGNLVNDIELVEHENFKVVNNAIAVNYTIKIGDKYEEKTFFIDVTAFNQQAEFMKQYMTKGTSVIVFGRVEIGSYTTKDDVYQETQKIIVNEIHFGSTKKQSDEQSDANQSDSSTQEDIPTQEEQLDDIDDIEIDDIDIDLDLDDTAL